MKNRIKWFVLLLLFSGCYEDKGNYDYTPCNDVEIDLGNTMYTMVEGEVIHIHPLFTFALDSNETGLTYEWKLEDRLLSTERDLSYEADSIMKGKCYLRVKDSKTGITYIDYTIFDITEKYDSQGWMILSEKENTSYFTYIREKVDDSAPVGYAYAEYPGVYESEMKEKLGGKPVGLLEHFYYRTTCSNIWVLQEGAETVDLSGRSLKKEITLNESFLSGQMPANFVPLKMTEMRWLSAVINRTDHKVYTRKKTADNSYFTGSFLDLPLQYEGKDLYVNDFVIATFIGPGYTLMVEGRKGQQRYLALVDKDKSSAGKVLPLTPKKVLDGFSPFDDLGDLEVVYTGFSRKNTMSSGINRYHSILKNAAGEYYYQEFEIAKMSNTQAVNATPLKQVKLDLPDILDETTLYNVASYPVSTYVMFAHGNDLYYIDRANIKEGVNIRSFLKLYQHFDAPITAMDSESNNSYRLGVGLENGKFYILNMKEGINDETQRLIYEAKAPLGRVVDIRYKIQRGNSWTS